MMMADDDDDGDGGGWGLRRKEIAAFLEISAHR